MKDLFELKAGDVFVHIDQQYVVTGWLSPGMIEYINLKTCQVERTVQNFLVKTK